MGMPAANAAYKRFAPANLDAGRFYFARAFKLIWSPHGRFSRGESMPGPPKVSATGKVDVDENGRISGLF